MLFAVIMYKFNLLNKLEQTRKTFLSIFQLTLAAKAVIKLFNCLGYILDRSIVLLGWRNADCRYL